MKIKTLIAAAVLVALGFGGGILLQPQLENSTAEAPQAGDQAAPEKSGEREILYWVAPMDPSYRSDKPGKSPMGMDLVPVYADQGGGEAMVSIDPAVVQNLGVRTAPVERGTLWRRIDTVGYVDYDERRLSHVHLRTDGWIDKLYVKSDGESVKKGEVLFELYSRELVNAQEEYLQALKAGNQYLRGASRDRLIALGMSREQLNELKRTRKISQLVRYHAQQDGVVDGLNVREGMYVKPATEVMTLADLSSVWLLVDVFERQSNWVEVGQPAEVSLPYLPGRTWEGEVEFVYPRIDPKTRTLQVRLRFDNPQETLKPDMYADVRIYAGPKKGVLSIPTEALIRTGDSARVVLALGEGRFDVREVVPGMESGDRVEIIRGLEEGETVVTSAQFLIDSEASLRASFKRMGGKDEEGAAAGDKGPVMGMGTVHAIDAENRRLNISHAPIEALGWPEMRMDFELTEAASLEGVQPGSKVHFTLVEDADGNYRIDSIRVVQ
ncbi:efflux RND transporter periplasmic adaptor subunit [Thiohalobacter sp. IOR34]|uniref:efflux RND transporter periplasmic adaptor subunit n=1 Tax=Thiohalobacter sp. IOR34 TaxID=3057176 RepID=UPI0025B09033|nr:efflux RND transporter periplasmic adaptor subunit [Thiohalobacter sp. IOR34]WJW74279.1 efflux RND transporter periplasmic adaptor subunit [Thiohalobacter sp. IOR34]